MSGSLGVVAVSIVTEQSHIVEELLKSLVAPLGIPPIDCLHVDWSLDRGVVVCGCRGREKLERQPKVLTKRALKKFIIYFAIQNIIKPVNTLMKF